MGLHLVAIAKLNLLTTTTHGGGACSTSMIYTLICPYLLRITFNIKIIRQTSTDLVNGLRLFFFQLARIALDSGGEGAGENNRRLRSSTNENYSAAGRSRRWNRALRLISERIAQARRWFASAAQGLNQHDQDSLSALAMLAL